MKCYASVLLLVSLGVPRLEAAPAEAPAWLQEHFERMTAKGGRWLTDNSPYRSEQEPWDAYGLEWTWGVGKQSIKGRLYGLSGGQEKATFWEYRLVWHPGDAVALLYQFGVGGTFGFGPMKSPAPGIEELEQTFWEVDGRVWRLRHTARLVGEALEMSSLHEVDGGWEKRRTYTWRRVE